MKITVAGYYGFGNVGDELLLKAVLEGIRRRVPTAQPLVLTNNPLQTAKSHGVAAASRWNALSILRAVGGADELLFGGGGVFQDRTSKRSLLYYAGLVILARLVGTPVALCGVGVDEMHHPLTRNALRLAVGRDSVMIGVRDSTSVAALQSIGVDSPIGLFADLVFSLDMPPLITGGHAALVVRDARQENRNAMFGWITRVLKERGLHVDAMSFQPGTDARAALAGGGTEATLVDFSEAPARVGSASVVVSARFHALVLAALAGRPFLGIGEPSSKIQSICKQLLMPFVPWDATRDHRNRAAEQLFEAAAPDARRVAALKRRAEEALDGALRFL